MTEHIDVSKLRETAEAATPGPWQTDGPFWVDPFDGRTDKAETRAGVTAGADRKLVMPGEWETKDADAEHIATFDPPTVLALLDRLERAEAAVERVRAVLRSIDAQVERGGWEPLDFVVIADKAEAERCGFFDGMNRVYVLASVALDGDHDDALEDQR